MYVIITIHTYVRFCLYVRTRIQLTLYNIHIAMLMSRGGLVVFRELEVSVRGCLSPVA